jgi:hypothetical protein
MPNGYQSFELAWQDLTIEVSFQANWFGLGHWHLQLKCCEPLPVTETGYRSHFVSDQEFNGEQEIRQYIVAWLEHEATNPAWIKHMEDSRQLKLF